MRASISSRVPSETSDAVGLIIALFVRFPEIATIVSHPAEQTLTLSFAVRARIDRATQRTLREALGEHVRSLLGLGDEAAETLEVAVESDEAISFVRITRDAASFTREELQVVVAVLADRFGKRLVRSAPADDDAAGDEAASDDLVDVAIDALRDPSQQRSLVGFREEKRVLVYFVKSRKKAKARARS